MSWNVNRDRIVVPPHLWGDQSLIMTESTESKTLYDPSKCGFRWGYVKKHIRELGLAARGGTWRLLGISLKDGLLCFDLKRYALGSVLGVIRVFPKFWKKNVGFWRTAGQHRKRKKGVRWVAGNGITCTVTSRWFLRHQQQHAIDEMPITTGTHNNNHDERDNSTCYSHFQHKLHNLLQSAIIVHSHYSYISWVAEWWILSRPASDRHWISKI